MYDIFALKPGDKLGDYEILYDIARGGMSHVYKARTSSGLERALKVLPPNAPPVKRDALKWEADISKVLGGHDNIVAVHEYGEQDLWSYVSMDFVNGKSVFMLTEARGWIQLAEALYLTIETAKGLQHAHDKGIIHADVKPGNILVDERSVRLTDFGIAYDTNRKMPVPEKDRIMGTLPYIAPEQTREVIPTVLSDVYALSLSLYHMLAGEAPFTATSKSDAEVIKSICNDIPPSLCSFLPGIPQSVDLVVLKSLSKNPAERHRSASEFASALGGLLGKI